MKIICFSANASILAGVILLAIGTVTVHRADKLARLPYAIIPMAFGVQQLVEGYLWTVLPMQSRTTDVATIIYLLFSHVLWPILVPVAVLLIEPAGGRRRLLAIAMAAGALAGIFFLIALSTQPVAAVIDGKHIVYHLPHRHDSVILLLYIIGTCVAPLLSSYKAVQLFGAVITISLTVTWMAYVHWFASVWCFFAGLMSGIVYLHFSQHRYAEKKASIAGAA